MDNEITGEYYEKTLEYAPPMQNSEQATIDSTKSITSDFERVIKKINDIVSSINEFNGSANSLMLHDHKTYLLLRDNLSKLNNAEHRHFETFSCITIRYENVQVDFFSKDKSYDL